MTGHVKVAGAWKDVASGHVKVGGVWKNLVSGYTNIGGTWKQWYASTINYSIGYLVVAGGGSGSARYSLPWASSGGGGGGYVRATNVSITSGTSHTITVGAGATGSAGQTTYGLPGSNSVFSSYTASGGGYGTNCVTGSDRGGNGGSGGGGQGGGTAVSGQGFNGGTGGVDTRCSMYDCTSAYFGAGGGGAGGTAVQGSITSFDYYGETMTHYGYYHGGPGITTSISGGTAYNHSGGGGGVAGTSVGNTIAGNSGGFGATAGAIGSNSSANATVNTGGGSGGGGTGSGSGGSGVVIIWFPDTLPNITSIGAGLTYTLTVSGGYKTYKFTAGTGTVIF